MEKVFDHDYLFDDFILNSNGVLSFHGQEISVPPKELHVLVTLLDGKGGVVHKNNIIDQVWGERLVGDESLTRCVYSLRRLLRESKNNKYIETVYGKGYRFAKTVTMVEHKRPSGGRCKLAIFPFSGASELESAQLHSQLLDLVGQSRSGEVSLVPAMLTRNQTSVADVLALCHRLELDYYLSGEFRRQQGQSVLVLELVDGGNQHLVWRETLTLDGCEDWSERMVRLAAELPACIPGSSAQASPVAADEARLCHLMARRCLRVREPEDLNMALQYLQMGLVQEPMHAPSLTALAETWLALALQGEVWPEHGLQEARHALDKALSLTPTQPLPQSVMGWWSCLGGGDALQAINWLSQAAAHPQASAEVHLYHALALYAEGDCERSLQVLNVCLARDGHLPPALMLKLRLLSALGRDDEAIACGLGLATQRMLTPRLHGVLALVFLHSGQFARAQSYVDQALAFDRASLPEQIFHALVLSQSDPAAAAHKLKGWQEEVLDRYRCPALLTLLALSLGMEAEALSLLALAREQRCVWLPLVRSQAALEAFVARQPSLEWLQ